MYRFASGNNIAIRSYQLSVYEITACDYPSEEYDDEEDAEWNRQYDLQDEDNCNEWALVCQQRQEK